MSGAILKKGFARYFIWNHVSWNIGKVFGVHNSFRQTQNFWKKGEKKKKKKAGEGSDFFPERVRVDKIRGYSKKRG